MLRVFKIRTTFKYIAGTRSVRDLRFISAYIGLNPDYIGAYIGLVGTSDYIGAYIRICIRTMSDVICT